MRNKVRKLLWFILLVLVPAGTPSEAWAETVVVLSSDSLTSTRRTISGARSAIRNERDSVLFVPVLLSPEAKASAAQTDSIRSLKPDIILTVGSAATRFAKDSFLGTPIVFSAVMYPLVSGFIESFSRPGEMITGASLDIPADLQFRYFRQIIPEAKKIGVLYTSNTARLIPPSRVVAAEMGLELVTIKVTGQKDLSRALDSLTQVVDGLWSVADPNLFDPKSTKYILLNSLRRGVPFMGFSRYVVESGALFALDFDYKAIGRQAGRIVFRILDGAKPGSITVTTPDIIWFHYNEKTAQHLDVQIPADLVAIAKEVYR